LAAREVADGIEEIGMVEDIEKLPTDDERS
jgi:hypothetical protein